ncbi:hypothetical protein Nepgr_016935 [Nepenthes gracilis]|uniref:GRAM domain-containing protein n=1 Tax=Nepenthes gracilis TaxID=150966 RepID=A0AAD3SQM1_NEPGR|nr:hypothetical protein Nepgr_016935 [Nepenthes gracilis]
MTMTDAAPEDNQPPAATKEPGSTPPWDEEETKRRGTLVIGAPENPVGHPDRHREALPDNSQQQFNYEDHPYLVYSPVQRSSINPFKPVINRFTTWSRKASNFSQNVWNNLRAGPSVSKVACGKITLSAKAITKGGFEPLFKQIFNTEPNEKLKKSFACYLYTTTGPVAGTLYMSTVRIGFCSDRPLSFPVSSGKQAWFYYKVMIALRNMSTVNPVTTREETMEKCIEMVTVDGHSFWLMGFVNFEKALHNLLDTLSGFREAECASRPAAPT